MIHRQIELSDKAYEDLTTINALFYNLCFDILSKFNIEKGEENLDKRLNQNEIDDVEEY